LRESSQGRDNVCLFHISTNMEMMAPCQDISTMIEMKISRPLGQDARRCQRAEATGTFAFAMLTPPPGLPSCKFQRRRQQGACAKA
jgi:hypothetical protein